MTRRLASCDFALCVAISAVATAQDRPEGYAELFRELEGDGFQTAMDELTAAGPAAVPQLVSYVRSARNAPSHRIRAVRVLGRMGAGAAASVPELLELLPERNLQSSLVVALGRIGPHAPLRGEEIRAALVAEMMEDQAAMRSRIPLHGGYPVMVETYSRTLLDPGDTTAALTAALQHENPFVRAFAAELLFTRGEATDPVITALHEAVTSSHPKGVDCEIPGTISLQMEFDLDRRIHRLASRALVRLAPTDPRSVPGHRIMLDAMDPAARMHSVLALGRLGSTAAPAVPELMLILENDLLSLRREAVTTLGMIGAEATAAIPVLERLAEHRDRQLAERARASLRQIRR